MTSSGGAGTTGEAGEHSYAAPHPAARADVSHRDSANSGAARMEADNLFAGPGAVRALGRAFDWSATPLGPVSDWPAALRTGVRLMLDAPIAMSLWCGPEYLLLYNDAYRSVLGGKHPAAFGRSGAVVWSEIWDELGPQLASVRAGGPPFRTDETRFVANRLDGGLAEEAWFSYSLSALRDETGEVLAVIAVASDVSERIRERHALTAANAQLQDQQLELELANQQLQDNASELEMQAEELQATATRLEERTEEAEAASKLAEAAEEQLRAVFAQAPAAVALSIGPEHRYVLANPNFMRVAGRALVGRTYREAFADVAAYGYEAVLDQVYSTGVPFVANEVPVTFVGDDGQSVDGYFSFVYQPLRDGEGSVIGIVTQLVDMTAQVQARQAVTQREQELRTLADAIPTLAWTARPDGYIDWYNARWYEYTGTVPEQMEGWGWTSVHDPLRLPQVLERWKQSIATGEPFEMEFPLKGADGAFRWFLNRVVPVRGVDGAIVRWFGTNTDVDERQRVEAKFRATFEQAAVGICHTAPTGAWIDTNQRFCDILGYSRDELRSMTFAAVTHPDDLVRDLLAVREMQRGERARYATEKRYIRKDGTTVWAQLTSAFVRDDGSYARGGGYLVSVVEDISERKATEARLEAVNAELETRAEQLQETAMELEAQSEELQQTTEALMESTEEAIHARDVAESAVAQTWALQSLTAAFSAAVTPTDVVNAFLELGTVAVGAKTGLFMLLNAERSAFESTHGTGYSDEVVEMLSKVSVDGPFTVNAAIRERAPQWIHSRDDVARRFPATIQFYDAGGFAATATLPLMTGDDRVMGVLAFNFEQPQAFDYPEREFIESLGRLAAQALERSELYATAEAARREAQEANASKSQFLANMSHELRQPLNAITGYADLITMGVRGAVTDQQRDDLERIKSSSTHLTSLISDILQFAKLEAGQLVYDVTSVPVDATLREVATFIAPQVRAKHLMFNLEHCDASVAVRADRDRFIQAVLNLLTNATKYTPDGRSITVSCITAATEHDHVMIRVADTGIGIPSDKLPKIFDPFVQVNRSLKRPAEGVGLGLAIARDIARHMGGDLTVESEEGVGSTFTLTLPRD